MRLRAALVLLSFLFSACYSYVPVETVPQRRGTGVRVGLTVPQDIRLIEVTANDIATVDGELVAVDSSIVVLSAMRVESLTGYESLAGGATVRIPREHIAELQEKRFSVLRSAGLVGLALLFTAGLGEVLGAGGDDRGGDTGGPEPR
jgi:hypothetical protein